MCSLRRRPFIRFLLLLLFCLLLLLCSFVARFQIESTLSSSVSLTILSLGTICDPVRAASSSFYLCILYVVVVVCCLLGCLRWCDLPPHYAENWTFCATGPIQIDSCVVVTSGWIHISPSLLHKDTHTHTHCLSLLNSTIYKPTAHCLFIGQHKSERQWHQTISDINFIVQFFIKEHFLCYNGHAWIQF